MTNMADFISRKWEPILDLPEDWTARLRSPQVEALNHAWLEQAQELREQGIYQRFLEKLKRRWSVETGVIEGLYSITEGATRVLIEKGLDAALIARTETDDDPSSIVQKIQDHQNAIEGLYQFVSGTRPLGTSYIKELHRVLTVNQPTYTARDTLGNWVERELPRGCWKTVGNDVEHVDGGKFEFAPPEHVPQEMDRLIDLHHQHMTNGVPADVEAAWLHHRFAVIHPFTDGNGRVARCLATLVFLKMHWLPLVVTRYDRDSYITALRKADAGDLKPLIDVFGSLQKKAIREALSLSEVVISERQEFAGILSAVKAKFAERRITEQDQRRRAIVTADSLFTVTKTTLESRAAEINSAISVEGAGFGAFLASAENGSDRSRYYYRQIVQSSQFYGYFANLEVYRSWVSLILQAHRRSEILVSFHGVGHQSSGILCCTAMFFTKDRTEDGETEVSMLNQLGPEPFEFTYTENDQDVRRRFSVWFDRVMVLGLQQWQEVC
jgi:Fic family protein